MQVAVVAGNAVQADTRSVGVIRTTTVDNISTDRASRGSLGDS